MDHLFLFRAPCNLRIVILDYFDDGLKQPESHCLIFSLSKETEKIYDICCVLLNKVIAIELSLISGLDIRLRRVEQNIDSAL